MTCKWALLYIERWLTAPMAQNGIRIERTRGTPQGGVISPILSALFLHYAFDLWMNRTHPDLPWCRYADDGLVHCRTEQEAEALRAELQARLTEFSPPRDVSTAIRRAPSCRLLQGATSRIILAKAMTAIRTISPCFGGTLLPTVQEWGRRLGAVRHATELRMIEKTGIPGTFDQAASGPPTSIWALAPASMAWESAPGIPMTGPELCSQLKDKARNGSRTLSDLLHHLESEPLVKWAFNPGTRPDGEVRKAPPIIHEALVQQFQTWMDEGAPCPSEN